MASVSAHACRSLWVGLSAAALASLILFAPTTALAAESTTSPTSTVPGQSTQVQPKQQTPSPIPPVQEYYQTPRPQTVVPLLRGWPGLRLPRLPRTPEYLSLEELGALRERDNPTNPNEVWAGSDEDEPFVLRARPEYYGDDAASGELPASRRPAPLWHSWLFAAAILGIALIVGLDIATRIVRGIPLLRLRGPADYHRA